MPLLSAKEAARRLGISPSLVRRYCRQGRLGERAGTYWVILQAELDAFAKIPRKPGRPSRGADEAQN